MESIFKKTFEGRTIYHFKFTSSSINGKILEGSCRANSLSEARIKYLEYLQEFSYKDVVMLDVTF